MAQVLHCLQDPLPALREAHRVLIPGGRILIQELRTHQEEWVRDRFGDIRLGFEKKELLRLLKEVRFAATRIDMGARRHGDPFTILIGCGRKRK
jgi:ArsR family transcriptional regulator